MKILLGILRCAVAFPTIAIGSILILLVNLLPIKIKGIGLGPWMCTLIARLAMFVFGIQYRCADPQKILAHTGIVLANHCTFFDILMLICVMPMRFLSALENKSWPFIGWVAVAIGTVFVDRGNKESRNAAREAIVRAPKFPPVVLFPEGGISPPHTLRPFRYGSFEVVVESQCAYLPVTIKYEPQEIIAWQHPESFFSAFWRTASYPKTIRATVTPLEAVHPTPQDDIKALTVQTHRAMADSLGFERQM
jgi:1-acyl-sn-glycerol-3-phosphate acyltransferase